MSFSYVFDVGIPRGLKVLIEHIMQLSVVKWVALMIASALTGTTKV